MSKLILVTGASSFIGEWVIKLLLEKGYRVRGTVRSAEKAKKVLDGVDEAHRTRLSFVYVEDIARDSFDQSVIDVDGIIHIASPFHFRVEDPEKDLLLPAINGTLGVLRSAHRFNREHHGQIRRIVLTSSFASVLDASKGSRPGYVYREDDWCPLTYADGVAAKNDPATVYRASKTCAERAAWKFLEDEHPSFTLATLCEPLVFGPRVNGFQSLDDVNTSNGNIWSLISNGPDAPMPSTRVPMEIDVRDVAFAHVAALEVSSATNARYLLSAGTWTHQQVADIIHHSPKISSRIKAKTPIGRPGQPLDECYRIDTSKAERELSVTFIPLQKTIEDLVEQFDRSLIK